MQYYDEILKEHFDLNHYDTLQCVTSINEADQNKVLESLTSKLYNSIVDKVADIDYGTIPQSKGDITQMQGYDDMMECVSIIENILVEYKQDTTLTQTVKLAANNVAARKDMFSKAFAMEVDLPRITYNTLCLSIVASVSLLITTSIEFIKDAGADSFSVKFDKVSYAKTKDSLLFTNLGKFNTSCQNGEFDKSMEHVIEMTAKNFMGVGIGYSVAGTVAIIGTIRYLIPLLRELIFFFFYAKQSISDYFAIQADLLQINAEYVKQNPLNGKTEKERKEIYKKQNKVVEAFRKTSNKLQVEVKTGESKATKQSKADAKKYKIDDLEVGDLEYSQGQSSSSIF